MERFDHDITEAVELCLKGKIPFCLYRFPGALSENVFFANPSGSINRAGRKFFIGKWGKLSQDFIYIYEESSAQQIIALKPVQVSDHTHNNETKEDNSTSWDNYVYNLSGLINELRNGTAHKVVFSRIKTKRGTYDTKKITHIANLVFNEYPGCFRYIYFTRDTGLWIGASPELLLDYSLSDSSVETYAVAGTRKSKEKPQRWDNKNIREHEIVRDYITAKLSEGGYKQTFCQETTIHTGNLEHLLTIIQASPHDLKNTPSAYELIDLINPTPALCGYPKEKAKELIDKYENHNRECYGGVIGTEDRDGIRCFVNIRCAHLTHNEATMYGGGGILPESDIKDEWEESENKLQTLEKFL